MSVQVSEHPAITTSERRAIQQLSRRYAFRNPNEVYEFLAQYPFLIPVLERTPSAISERFGEGVELALEVSSDPESPERRGLYALIVTNERPEAALDKLERLDYEWWLPLSGQTHHLLNIDVECR